MCHRIPSSGLFASSAPSLGWPFLVWFSEAIFREDHWIVEREQEAWDRQSRDANQEIFSGYPRSARLSGRSRHSARSIVSPALWSEGQRSISRAVIHQITRECLNLRFSREKAAFNQPARSERDGRVTPQRVR